MKINPLIEIMKYIKIAVKFSNRVETEWQGLPNRYVLLVTAPKNDNSH